VKVGGGRWGGVAQPCTFVIVSVRLCLQVLAENLWHNI